MAKKIVITSNTSWSLWNFRLGLMRALKEKGYKVISVAPKDKYSEYISKEFEYFELKNLDRKGKNPYKDVKLTLEYLNLYKKIKPDLVLNYTIKPNIYSSIACGFLKIPCVSVITGLGYVYVKEGILKKITDSLYKIAFKFNKKIVFQNQSDKDFFIENNIVSKNKAVVIYGMF
ncbi:glycosyltransferase [Sulfurihydrogenibium sp.]|uniref:glycosyltransferase n=1 Tax=Sulfurihydrogenibium sp. TaxID=2053621 RepID=UPI0026306B73|nr:glycosyltransferase [Sulfurihydrogenibium sp.]